MIPESFSDLFFMNPLWDALMVQARGQALWCDADVAPALTSCPYDAGAKMAQVRRHLQSWAAGSCTVQDVNSANSPPLLTFLIMEVWSKGGFNKTLPRAPQSYTTSLSHCVHPTPFFSNLLHGVAPIRRLLILCHSGVFSSAISWPGACALLSLGWVCLVDCSTGTDWHSSWGLQGLHTQSTKHVSVWGAALLPKYEVGFLIYHILSLFNKG